jgi:hypothetical protein
MPPSNSTETPVGILSLYAVGVWRSFVEEGVSMEFAAELKCA